MNTTTPMFEHPLHALLTDLGFAEGEAEFEIITLDDGSLHVTLCAPTGFMLCIQLPDTNLKSQLGIILRKLQKLSYDTFDLDEATERFACDDDPQETRDTLAATHLWAEMQADRISGTGRALCDLMLLDPTTMPASDFLQALWQYAFHGESTGILFTMLDEHLKATDHPFTRRPAKKTTNNE